MQDRYRYILNSLQFHHSFTLQYIKSRANLTPEVYSNHPWLKLEYDPVPELHTRRETMQLQMYQIA